VLFAANYNHAVFRGIFMKLLRIATRGSDLALWQARFVADRLLEFGVHGQLVVIETQGDRVLMPFATMNEQGVFTKAIQDAVLFEKADIAVHSYKDLPSAHIQGLQVAAVPERADSRDVLLALPDALDSTRVLGLKAGVVLGTSAVRRKAQVQMLDAQVRVADLRGNVPNRVAKLRASEFDAIIVAAAGLNRLGLSLEGLSVRVLESDFFVPAPAQGALALECRSDDWQTFNLLQKLGCSKALRTVEAERGLMMRFDGGCQLALGASAQLETDGMISLVAWYGGYVFTARASSVLGVIENVHAQIVHACPEGLQP
jgi:hydroxymethylbilane synthase